MKEIARLGGDVSAFVPAHVQAALAGKSWQWLDSLRGLMLCLLVNFRHLEKNNVRLEGEVAGRRTGYGEAWMN